MSTSDRQANFVGKIAGRLALHLAAWEMIGASRRVLSWIENGFPIPFGDEIPGEHDEKNYIEDDHQHNLVVDKIIEELLDAGAISLEVVKPIVVSAIGLVPKKEQGKFRFLLDLRWLNAFCKVPTFTMDTLSSQRDSIRHGDVMFNLDLASGFHHVCFREDHTRFCGFRWKQVFYKWKSLPFGGSFAPWGFCECMSFIASYFRRSGIRCIAYMDDFGFFLRPEDAEWQRDFILQTFEDLGLLLNDKKSQFHKRGGPFTQRLKLLGFWIDTSEDKFICDPDRIAGAKSLARERSARTRVSARDLSRFLGKMQSLGLCLGKWVRLYTRHLYDAVESSVESREGGWNSLVDISSTECKRVRVRVI